MDSVTDLQQTTEEAPHADLFSPPVPNYNHPPYPEMITAAIVALKDKNGSSRQAIAKHIESAYTNLPPNHSDLLTHHLKHLKTSGYLVMLKHSYALASSPPLPNDYFNPAPAIPGLPSDPSYASSIVESQAQSDVPVAVPDFHRNVTGPEPMFVSLGLADIPPPPAVDVSDNAASEPPLVVKRGRGRPPKSKTVGTIVDSTGKRGRGRPPRGWPVNVPLEPNTITTSGSASTGRPRGRPRKHISVNANGRENLLTTGQTGQHSMIVAKSSPVIIARRPRNFSRRSLGRPRKMTQATAVFVTDPRELVAYQELKAKLEHLQSRVRHAVEVIKPCVNYEGGVIALQELEALSIMDVDAPLNVEAEAPQPPPQQNQDNLY